MEILLNELSLNGQFNSVEHFITEGLYPFINVVNDIGFQYNLLYKKYDFWRAKVTQQYTIHDIMLGKTSRQYDEIRKFKSQLAKLFDDPYWENNPKHTANNVYSYNGKDVFGSSLAEACERDRLVVSFQHKDFLSEHLSVYKNVSEIEIDNLFKHGHFTQLTYRRELINFDEFCCKIFSKSKLNFSKINPKKGFSLVKKEDEILFYNGFKKFSELSWTQIGADAGLRYKEYKGGFKHISEKIYEFRISEKYRCFGYKRDDVFFVIHFDMEHKLGDT